MVYRRFSALAVALASLTAAQSHQPGSFEDGGDTLVSGMMLFLGNDEKVYILDKAENNKNQIHGHPAAGAVYDIATRSATIMDIQTNAFCSSGMHLPNGSFITLGGNGAVAPGGGIGDVIEPNTGGTVGLFDSQIGFYDGGRAIRIVNPCTGDFDPNSPQCGWFDNSSILSMQSRRWYSTAEPMADGTVAIIGGFTNGGYINRNVPNTDPALEGGAANPTFEFFPANGPPQQMQFIIDTSGLNSYPHTFNLPSGRMFLQANVSSTLWDPKTNQETRLPNMPGNIVRVYPASGATAMLPLTPANNWTPTIIFCGGSDMPEEAWGDYSWPYIDTWLYPASNKCHRITPEPTDGSAADYIADDDMLEGRTMGQFIALPDQTFLVVNGGMNGTAGYATRTLTTTSYADMPFGMSLASGPVGTPAIYNPKAAAGQRWSNTGFSSSQTPRLYHSSAILLPDASVMIAGSNPNVDVNLTTIFPTTYKAEIFYPSYFGAKVRPVPQNMPKTLSYGGDPFDITIPANSYSGSSNDAADNTTVIVIRPGWTTHAMNMGQRLLQLNNTYTVNQDGSLTLHVAQVPPNPNILQPGPALLFVVMNGVPSNGTMLIVGNGAIGNQPTSAASSLPGSVRLDGVSGTAGGSSGSTSSNDSGGDSSSNNNNNTSGNSSSGGSSKTGPIVGGVVGAIALVGIAAAVIGIVVARRRRANAQRDAAASYPMNEAGRGADTTAFMPLQYNASAAWDANASSYGINTPYKDERGAAGTPTTQEYDPYYQNAPRMGSPSRRF